VNGVPILVNTLTHLANVGICETVIVVGHLKEKIIEQVGYRFHGMDITYVESECYSTTNNIYSLWLTREHLDEDILLLEADVLFEQRLIDRMLGTNGGNQAAVVRHQPGMSGTVVCLDDEGIIESLIESKHQGSDFKYHDTFKTVNIYRFSGEFLRNNFLPCLNAAINAGNVHDYYETILRELCDQYRLTMTAVHCDDIKWIEVDNLDDLTAANYLFANQRQRYEHISGLHGDYWRYSFVDHALLYNLFFPPQALLDEIAGHLRELVLNYPSGQDILAGLMGVLIDQPAVRIVVGNGVSELIKVIGRRLNKRLIVPVPSFNEWINAAPAGTVIESALLPPFFQLDVDSFVKEAIDSGADIAVVVNPNNPTSLAIPKLDLLRLVKQLAEKDTLLIIDESFIDFTEEPPATTMVPEIERYQNLIIVKSLGKCCGVGGLRLGYLLTTNFQFSTAVREELSIWNINSFAEIFLRLAPRYWHQFVSSCRRVRMNCDELYRRLDAIPGLVVYRPDANFVLCRLPDNAMSGPELSRRLFIDYNILIKDCAGKTMPQADRYVRIASRTEAENELLVKAITEIIIREAT
jgi:histidinol-phosphate/aromatic aminotransferase/cobyric acid decarboxylase-like protein